MSLYISRARARVRSEAAADQDVIALDGIAVVVDRHPCSYQPYVADVMLSRRSDGIL